MDSDPQIILALMAVRMQGPNPSAKLDVFKKLKSYLATAHELNLIQQQKVDVATIKNGKSKTKKEDVLTLTEEGKKYLEANAGPEAQTAAVLARAREIQQQLQADRDALRAEVKALLSKKSTTPDPAKAIKTLSAKIDEVAKRLAQLEENLKPANDDALLAQIDQAFASLQQKLEARLGTPPANSRPAASTQTAPLRAELRRAYENLCLFREFEDGLVEIPRLYHEARRAMPQLTVHAFHQELESLWSQRVLELSVLNEVRSASEPDKAIRHGDNLYYYVYWAQP